MRLVFQGTVPKVLDYPGDNEDAVAVDVARGRLAVSDGASESYDSRTWANLLVRRFVRDTRLGPAWVRRAAAEFGQMVNRDDLSWSKQASFDRGSFATLLGVQWEATTQSIDIWCIGDSLVALLDGTSLVSCLPYAEATQFQQRPHLLCTNHALNGFVASSGFRRALHHTWRTTGLSQPVLLCMTDGLAEWAIRESAGGRRVWEELVEIDALESLQRLVSLERGAHNMRVDDVVLAAVALDPDPGA
jgi:hypothetical protein